MTRKHFQAIARIIAAIEDPTQRTRTCQDAIRELRQFNPLFDRYKFEEACGVTTAH
jgi:hypothetical protein